MNDDFEAKLLELASIRNQPDPTAAWRSGILARAMREAETDQPRFTMRPPRWLMVAWGTAWAASLVLHFSAPQTTVPPGSSATGGAVLQVSMPLGAHDALVHQLLTDIEIRPDTSRP